MASPSPTADSRRAPPDERFWQRYSPHHELPLSGVTSAVLHILVVALLLLAAWVAYKLGWGQEKQPLPVVPVAVEGGGDTGGGEKGPGPGGTQKQEQERGPQPPEARHPQPPVSLKDLDPGRVDPVDIPNFKNDEGEREIPYSKKAMKTLQGIQKDVRKKLFGSLAGEGPGGPGTGQGPGTGPGGGARAGRLSEQQRRQLSWVIRFRTTSGEDYVRQLAAIGAILAIPQPDGSFLVIRDLHQRPATGKIEDIYQFHRIFCYDNKPDDVAGVAHALDIPVPAYFAAFLPGPLEEQMAKLEHDYRGWAPNQIEETDFEFISNGNGSYRPVVFGQTPKH